MRQKPEAICTVALIVINIAVFLILTVFGDTEDAAFMLGHGAMYEPYITEGHEYYRNFPLCIASAPERGISRPSMHGVQVSPIPL